MCLVCLRIPYIKFWTPEVSLYETWYIYHDTWAYLNGLLHKSLPLMCLHVYPLSLLGNGSVKSLPRQWMHTK
jgi:hypothetical protein